MLSPGVQRWIYKQGWNSLRAVQEKSAPIILQGKGDLLITAPTAGGKTEAAFLPVVSWLEESFVGGSYGVLCISPLKALINDQYDRLSLLCDSAHTSITPWHGDVSQSVKRKSWNSPNGILLITPESLEAMFVRKSHELRARVSHLQYVVIDEFHAFIGTERGMQLLSLIARLEDLLERPLRRIALSATIGDPQMALQYLRPDSSISGTHLDVEGEGLNLKLQLKTYTPQKGDLPSVYGMATDLFEWLRGSNNLVFGNSRRTVEEVTDLLAKACEASKLPVEFFAHHGSLSRDARHFLEKRLKDGNKPTTAVATSTLELGLDIGDVVSVSQIGAPANASSVRQRLGRSGRRKGASSILRVLIESHGRKKHPCPIDLLDTELFQAVAVIDLMLERWIEPPEQSALHLSTLIQQILSMIAFTGGITASHAFKVLCGAGPWNGLEAADFAQILRDLGEKDVISQLPSGELIVGLEGEKLVSSHTFYTAFEVPEEYRLVANGKTLGTLPVTTPYVEGQLLLFGGKRWSVQSIDSVTNTMILARARSGQAPTFGGEPAPVHRIIRQRMLELYLNEKQPAYCDEFSLGLMAVAREYFVSKEVTTKGLLEEGGYGYWFIWESDRILETVKVGLNLTGRAADRMGPCVILEGPTAIDDLAAELLELLESPEDFTNKVESQPLGKFDGHLSANTIKHAFVSEKLDIENTVLYLQRFYKA